MPMKVRLLNGREYVYVLAGDLQVFLGPKDDLENTDPKKILKAANAYGKTIEKQLKKYFDNVYECVDLMNEKDKNDYLYKRREKLKEFITRFT